jgi:hypothetical protein
MNVAWGLALPTDGTWNEAMGVAIAKYMPKTHAPTEWISGKDWVRLLTAFNKATAGSGGTSTTTVPPHDHKATVTLT